MREYWDIMISKILDKKNIKFAEAKMMARNRKKWAKVVYGGNGNRRYNKNYNLILYNMILYNFAYTQMGRWLYNNILISNFTYL